MITELARIDIRDGQAAQFEEAVVKGLEIVKAAKGCHSVALHKSNEIKHRYWLIAVWDSVDAHVNGFQHSEGFKQWRALLGEHFLVQPLVEHLELLACQPDTAKAF